MEPIRDTPATLVDLLDRVLDKGIMLEADLMITMGGIPLIGLKLKAAIAGIETMLEYGIWEDWDEAQRVYAADEWGEKKRVPLLEGEELLLKMFSSIWYSEGIYQAWRPGDLYITNRRVFLYRKEPLEILFEAYYEDIEGFALEKKNIAKKMTDYLYLFLNGEEVAWFHPTEASPVKETMERRMRELGLGLEERAVPVMDEETETCPSCGRRAPVTELLDEGCKECGWISPRLKKKEIMVQH